jgi:hypothetical protein
MFKALAFITLGAAFYGPVLAAGSAVIGLATDTVETVNAATERRCATYNSVLPGACQMP